MNTKLTTVFNIDENIYFNSVIKNILDDNLFLKKCLYSNDCNFKTSFGIKLQNQKITVNRYLL